MQTILAGAMALLATMTASAAVAEPMFLRCDGGTVSVNPYDPAASVWRGSRFYRIDQGQMSRLETSGVVWPANVCATKKANCSTTGDLISAHWAVGDKDTTIQINRKSGRISDEEKIGRFLTTFTGDCAPSADPTASGAPNKF
jgi:hypothetical protein